MKGLPVKVSLIVPVYNVEGFLAQSIESCCRQTLRDLEIICVDDGSTDQSGKMLEEFKKADHRIKIIHKQNGGLSSARNAGMKAANGEWIMFLDSDDYLEPNACERVWIESQEAPTEIITFGSTFFPDYPAPLDSGGLNYVLTVHSHRYTQFSPDILFHIPESHPFVWRQAYSNDLLQKTGILFDETAKFGEDILFQFQIFPLANDFSFITDTLYHYRVGRKGSLMQQADNNLEKKLTWHIKIAEKIFTSWNRYGLLDAHGGELLAWSIRYVPELLLSKSVSSLPSLADQFVEMVSASGMDRYCSELPTAERHMWKKMLKYQGQLNSEKYKF